MSATFFALRQPQSADRRCAAPWRGTIQFRRRISPEWEIFRLFGRAERRPPLRGSLARDNPITQSNYVEEFLQNGRSFASLDAQSADRRCAATLRISKKNELELVDRSRAAAVGEILCVRDARLRRFEACSNTWATFWRKRCFRASALAVSGAGPVCARRAGKSCPICRVGYAEGARLCAGRAGSVAGAGGCRRRFQVYVQRSRTTVRRARRCSRSNSSQGGTSRR